MQLLIHGEVVAKFISHRLIASSFEMSGLPCIEYLAKYILRVPLETDWFSEPASNHFTEKGVFHAIIQENGTSLHI